MRIAPAVAVAALLVLVSGCGSEASSDEVDKTAPSSLSQFAASDSEYRMFGSVTWFDDDRGIAFMRSENGEDVFVHYSALPSPRPAMRVGLGLYFTATIGPRGLQAENVTLP